MTVSLSPVFNNDQSVVDANGAPRSGGLIHTYLAGTSTPATVYQTSSGSSGASHANPIELNANGLPPAPIWLTQGASYKFVLSNAGDTTPPIASILSIDNISGINDIADLIEGLATEWVPSEMAATRTSSTTFTVAGDQTAVLTVNRRIKITSAGTVVYAYIIKSTFTSLTTITVIVDGGTSLTAPLTELSYGILNAANTSLPYLSYDQQCCRLVYVSATSIRLDPQDGKMIWLYTAAAGWTRRSVSSSGVTAANTSTYVAGTSGQSLAASTTYYVYLFDNAGTLTLDFVSATAPAVDADTGLKIKTGDPTRLLVGMVRTNASSPGQFQTPALVLSWYRRRRITASGALTTTRTTTSASVAELNAEIRAYFLTWAEEAVLGLYSGYAANSTNAQSHQTGIYIDDVSTAFSKVSNTQTVTGTYPDNASLAAAGNATEGYHYLTIGVAVSANTGSWFAGQLSAITHG